MSDIKKTKDYSLFKLRDDNRNAINQAHVEALAESISSRNLMFLNPIVVNKDYEIINGQHRYLAAQKVGADIYYKVEDLSPDDMLLLNISQQWKSIDYLNFFVKRGKEEYIKIKNIMEKYGIHISTVIKLAYGDNANSYKKFRNGDFKFPDDFDVEAYAKSYKTVIDTIRKHVPNSSFIMGSRPAVAIFELVSHKKYDEEHFLKNLRINSEFVESKARVSGYFALFQKIYNYRTNEKIQISKYMD